MTVVTVTVMTLGTATESEEDECNAVITITSQSSDCSSEQFLVTIQMLWPRGKIQNIDNIAAAGACSRVFQPGPGQSINDCV